MDTGTKTLMLLSLATVAATLHVVSRPRAGHFLLARVPDSNRHGAGRQRVRACNVLVSMAAATVIFGSPDPTGWTQAAAVMVATAFTSLWMLVEVRIALRSGGALAPPSRFRVSLDPPARLRSHLSPTLWTLNLLSLVATPLSLLLWNAGDLGLWFLFAPLMLFINGLTFVSAWVQVRERRVLPADGGDRYADLQRERRTRIVRLLESALLCWNVSGALIWLSVALGPAGPGYLGAIIAVAVSGAGVVGIILVQLPPLTRIADELTALAGGEALGTRAGGWRFGGLIYFAPDDPALAVPRRNGLGQTLNLGRPTAWMFLAGAVLLPSVIAVLAALGASA